jgi:hypothetical protein
VRVQCKWANHKRGVLTIYCVSHDALPKVSGAGHTPLTRST